MNLTMRAVNANIEDGFLRSKHFLRVSRDFADDRTSLQTQNLGATLQDNDEKDSGPAKTHLRPAQRDVLATPTRVLHPALLALQPVLGLYANNAGKTSLPELIRPAFVLAGGGVAVWLVLRVLLRDKYRAGVAASIVIVASLAGWNFLEYFIGSVEPVAPAGPWLAFNVLYGVACVVFLLAYRRMFASQPGVLLSLALLAAFAAVLIGLANVFLRGAFGAFPTGSIVAYVTAVVFCLAVVARYSGDFVNWTQTLNWFAGVLLALYMLLAVGNVWRLPPEAKSPASPAKATASLPAEVTAKYPDIYFVALEGYARPDVLQRSYACDITPFLTAMQGKGFQTVPDSRSNYALALFSLTSCLNMDYLQDVLGERKNGPNPFAEVFNAYHHNRVYDFLKSKGYSLHVLAPGSEPLDPRSNIDVTYKPLRSLTEFERVLAKSTAAGRAVQFVRYLRDDKPSTRRAAFIRERTEFVFDRLAGLADAPAKEPRFIFANVPLPGGPSFAFDRDGKWPKFLRSGYDETGAFTGSSAECKAAYVDQVVYLNTKLEQTADDILKRAKRPSIVLLVSGNGPWFETVAPVDKTLIEERYSNLVLAYVPPELGGQQPLFSGTESLVNLFPSLFNRVLGASFPLKPDSVFISTATHPLDFTSISLSTR